MTDQPIDTARTQGIHSTIEVVWKHRRLICLIVIAFTVFTMILSMIMPRVYVARSTLLPPVSTSSNMMSLSGLEASLGLLGIHDEAMTTAKLFEQILQSRVLMEAVIERENLIEWYKLTDRPEREAMEIAVHTLRANSEFGSTDAGLIEISVKTSTPWFAGKSKDEDARNTGAGVANAFVEELDRINREKSLSRAKHSRIYLERQLGENDETIRTLSEELAAFQQTHGAVALDIQTMALIENAAELKGRLLSKEVELGIAEQTMTSENPVITALIKEIAQLRQGLTDLQGVIERNPGDDGAPRMDIPASEIPLLQLQLADYERELKARLLLQTYLNEQYYQAKIQEARDSPTIQVLDPAIPPIERYSPKRKLMAIGGLLSGVLIAILVVAILEWLGTPVLRPARRSE